MGMGMGMGIDMYLPQAAVVDGKIEDAKKIQVFFAHFRVFSLANFKLKCQMSARWKENACNCC